MKYNFEDPSQWNCNDHTLHNFGYMRATLPDELFQSLKEYCEQFDSARVPSGKEALDFDTQFSTEPEPFVSGLTEKYAKTSHHYRLTQELKESLWEFVAGMVYIYDKNSGYAKTLKFLDESLPFSMGDPWINVQESIHYLPVHSHDGVYSYTCWINLPPESLFEFIYPSCVGTPMTQELRLTQKDEGDMIVFPAGLQHCVHPFDYTYKNNPIDRQCKRISVSGNILLQTGRLLVEE